MNAMPKHPFVILCVGRRGAGKTYSAAQIVRGWRRQKDAGLSLAVDPVATDPPGREHLAAAADLYSPDMPDDIPAGITLIAVDEADLFAPQADARRRPPPPLVDLVRRGRHRGISLILCTQRPALVMRDVYALADAVIVCQTTDKLDLDRLCELHGVKEHRDAIATRNEPGPVLIWQPGGVELTR